MREADHSTMPGERRETRDLVQKNVDGNRTRACPSSTTG